MAILHRDETKELHLTNGIISYILHIYEGGQPGLLYFGRALDPGRSYRHLFPYELFRFDNGPAELALLECPVRGSGDFRCPALEVEHHDGSRVLAPVYKDHKTYAGKAPIPGLPSTYVEEQAEAESLEIQLEDEVSGTQVLLTYSLFRDYPVVARHMSVANKSSNPLRIQAAMSASLDLPTAGWEMITLSGTWARERYVKRRRIVAGVQTVSSLRGASSLQHNPFFILAQPGAGEDHGEIYGFSLVYSGNFLALVEVDHLDHTRAMIGINPRAFTWELGSGESFHTPEAVLAYSETGFGDLSTTYHDLYRSRLVRGPWRDRSRPVLINNWEGTYFNFNQERLLAIARAARNAGVELFVLDDGWFGKRDDDTSSLGDWFVDPRKLPDGIAGIARKMKDLGLAFGLWIEPEMVSPDSDLFRAHPDWAVGVPGRPRTPSRNQYVLDFSRPQIVDYVHDLIVDILRSASISYVKWDMNRSITEPYSVALPPGRQGEFFHRYILGVYDLYDRLTREFPEVLFESCASGGGRFDPGILAFAPQGWTSDDTDAVERLRIQWGTSLCYPLSSMGAHVSAVPNHQIGRVTPLSTRAAVAFFGVLGYELDASALRPEELKEMAEQIEFYKRHRELIQRGRFLRLKSPFEGDGNETAWMCVSHDAGSALVGFYRVLSHPSIAPGLLRLRGLEPRATYRISTWPAADDPMDLHNRGLRGGDELMQAGIILSAELPSGRECRGDYWARLFVLERVRI